MARVALLQMTSGIDPAANAATIVEAARAAKAGGATMLFTPEMCGLIDRDRARAAPHIVPASQNPVLAAAQNVAAEQGIWVVLGSLAIKVEGEERAANRTFVIDAKGQIAAQYDKIHMFDVDLAAKNGVGGETWRESRAYRPGDQVVTVETPAGRLGLAICYDLRFPALFEALGRARCDLIAIPAAFTVPTGAAHWHIMQRARAIEASAYVVSAAQVGQHQDGRATYGHSLVVDPWGDVLLDMGGDAVGLAFAEIEPQRLAEVRAQLPSLVNRRPVLTS